MNFHDLIQNPKDASASNDTIVYVFVYNPLAQNRSTYVHIPVNSEAVFRVERIENGEKSIYASAPKDPRHANGASKPYELLFPTGPLPPLSIVIFSITKEAHRGPTSKNTASSDIRIRRLRTSSRESLNLQNSCISATFDVSTGLLTGISAGDGVVVPFNQTWGYYTSFDSVLDSTNKEQNSGAYIFRPSVPDQKLLLLTPKRGAAKFVPTPVGIDVYSFFEEPWIWQITRLQNNSPYIEIEYHIGPIPIDDNRGKEIVTRYSTPIRSNGEFFTDSNGREFQKRRRNFRPTWNLDVFEPVAGNYYPVNAAIFVEDSTASLAVLVDRSQGGASLIDGSVEIMVQRRTLADDSRGVDEPLNETCGGMSPYPPYGLNERIGDGVSIVGKHRVRVGKGMEGARIARSYIDDVFAEPLIFVGSTAVNKPAKFKKGVYQGLLCPLPNNTMIITFSKLSRFANSYLIRIGHQYNAKEDENMGKPQIVDLSLLFANKTISSMKEMTLTGNQDLEALRNRRLYWNDREYSGRRDETSENPTTQINLLPMEIRTFIVTLTS